jgi:HAMP domain-containing protein
MESQVEQRLSAQLQALASKQQADQSTLAHTTTRALDAACSQWRQWREDSQATGVTRDEVDALERRLRGQVDQMRAEWDDERSQLRTALVTAKAEVSEVVGCRQTPPPT